MTGDQRWVRRPDGSTWGDFGLDDALGRMNLIDAAKTLEGIREVQEGLAFALGLPLTLPGGNALNPNRLPPVHRPNLRAGRPNVNCRLDTVYQDATDVLNDDLVVLHTQYSTQWDALAHAGSAFDADDDGVAEAVYYNGFRAGREVLGTDDPEACGIPGPDGQSSIDLGPVGIGTLAAHPVQTRGVMVDIAAHLGTRHAVVGHDDLQRIIAADSVEIRPGDIVTLHTGFAEMLVDSGGTPDLELVHHYGAVLDGRDERLLNWISETGIAGLAADNYAVELFPARPAPAPAAVLPLHEHCLFRLGVNLGELWRLTPLAKALRDRHRSAFLLTAPPLNLPGASGSPLNPVATL